ncbi:MAG: hypothetical protein KKI14_04290, partial [Nanoarchaeota archaeon]|nr:hypothetical protein [Nanoarchaeota archaeon]
MTKRGETLIEVIAALTCLVLAGLTAVTVAIQVMTTTATSKEYLIAQNLAREAIEGVVNIRDTNWLLFPIDKTNCWMIKDSSQCVFPYSEKVIINRPYILDRNAGSGKLSMDMKSVTLDIKEGDDAKTKFANFLLYVNDENLYTHTLPSPDKLLSPYPLPDFYRMVTFSKVDVADTDTMFNEERMKINVKVQWLQKGSIPKTY